MNLLAGELLQELLRILVRVDDDARAGLGGLVQPRRVGRADVDPGRDPARQIADGNRRLVGIRHAARELDALGVLEQVGEQPRHQILLRLRRVARDAQAQRLVDAAIGVGELDLEVVDGRGQRHAGSGRATIAFA